MNLSEGFFFRVTKDGKIPLLEDWVKAVERWALSNPNRRGILPGPKRVYDKRSNQQNKTVMGIWLDIILEEKGYEQCDKTFVFDQLKLDMGWTEDRVNKSTGEVVKVPKRTSNLDTLAFSQFMESFARHVAIHENIILPDPQSSLAGI